MVYGGIVKGEEGGAGDYHDYVFKDGKLIGLFDEMYRHSKEVPWHQDRAVRLWLTQVGLNLIESHKPYRSILDVGCGLGYVTGALRAFLPAASEGCRFPLEAFDVSPEAVRRAQAIHADIHFYVDDIRRPDFEPRQTYDLVVVKDIFWYVFPQLRQVIENLGRCVGSGGYLYLGQTFPAIEREYVGKEVIAGPRQLMQCFSAYEPVHSALVQDFERADDGPVLHLLLRRGDGTQGRSAT